MKPGPPTLGTFLLSVLLWLPLCLTAWYLAAQPHSMLLGSLSGFLLNLLHPGLVLDLEQVGQNLDFVTSLEVYPAPGQVGELVLEVNPLLYSYGLAFFLALMLAARARWSEFLVGTAMLVPFQSWGIVFDFLVQAGIRLGPEVAAQIGVVGWHREAIALSYQVGTLILPTLVPVALWAGFNRAFIQSLVHRH